MKYFDKIVKAYAASDIVKDLIIDKGLPISDDDDTNTASLDKSFAENKHLYRLNHRARIESMLAVLKLAMAIDHANKGETDVRFEV